MHSAGLGNQIPGSAHDMLYVLFELYPTPQLTEALVPIGYVSLDRISSVKPSTFPLLSGRGFEQVAKKIGSYHRIVSNQSSVNLDKNLSYSN